MLKDLIKLANHLDSEGLTKEADHVDQIIKKAQNVDEQTFLQPFIDSYESAAGYFSEDLSDLLEKHMCSDDLISPTLALDIAGFFPLLGEPADVANIAISLHCGKIVDAFLSALAVVPVLGIGATILKRLPGKPSSISEVKNIIVREFEHKIADMSSPAEIKELSDSITKSLEASLLLLRDFQRKAYASLPTYNPVLTNCDALVKQVERMVDSVEDIFLERYRISHSRNDISDLSNVSRSRMKSYSDISDEAKNTLISTIRSAGLRVSRGIVKDNIQEYRNLFKLSGVQDEDIPIIINFLAEKLSESKVIFDEVYSAKNTTTNLAMARVKYSDVEVENFKDFNLNVNISFNMPNILNKYYNDIVSQNFEKVIRDLESAALEELDHAIFIGSNKISEAWAYGSMRSDPNRSKKIFSAIKFYDILISKSTDLIKESILNIRNSIHLNDNLIEYFFDPAEFRAFAAKMSRYVRGNKNIRSFRDALYGFDSTTKIKAAESSGEIDESVFHVLNVLLTIRIELGEEVFLKIVRSIELFML